MRRRRRESVRQHLLKRMVRRVVRPERENAAGMQLRGEPGQPLRLVQRGVARMQQVSRRMVDIHQHRVEAALRSVGIETGGGMRHREEVAMDQAATRITRQGLAERKQSLLVPFDDLGKRVNHDQRSNARIFEHGERGVAEPEAADDDVEVVPIKGGQSEACQRDLGGGELARHQEGIAEFDFVDVDAGGWLPAAPQAEHAHRGRTKIQLFEIHAHGTTDLTATSTTLHNGCGPPQPGQQSSIALCLPRPVLSG